MKIIAHPSVEVLNDPSLYIDLLILSKTTHRDSIQLTCDDGSRANMVSGTVLFDHVNDFQGFVQCKQNAVYVEHYSFQVFVKTFMNAPIFRYESDGTAHNNQVPYLNKRKVKTPHFQRFDEQTGFNVAYRTDFIEDYEKELSENILLGLSKFCEECSIFSNTGKPITLLRQLEMFVTAPDQDLHNDITFEA